MQRPRQRPRQRSWSPAGKGLSVLMTTFLLGIGFTLASCETTPKNRFEYKRDGTPKKKKKYPTPAADCVSAPIRHDGGVFAFGIGFGAFAFVTPAAAADRQGQFGLADEGHVILAGGDGGDGGEGFRRCLDF